MKIAIAGASGFVGSALVPALRQQGHEVVRLVRRQPTRSDELFWDPGAQHLDARRLAEVDAVINLAGANLGASRWTAARRDDIRRSRVDATRTLADAIARANPRPEIFVSASAVGFYGDRGDEILTEASGIGRGFLPEVCVAWETQAMAATHVGVRTVLCRFGVILAGHGGALAKMLTPFRFGLGGPLGSGSQWMSWIALDDAVRAIAHVLKDPRCAGPMNIVAPAPVTNAEFAATLGRALQRPVFLRVPRWLLRWTLGRGLADEALLASTRAMPHRLMETSFPFRDGHLETALRRAVGEKV